jgi:hypothetical protein
LKYEMTDYWTGEPLAIDDKLFPRNVTTTIVCLKCVRGFMRGTEGSAPFDQGCATRAADFAAIDYRRTDQALLANAQVRNYPSAAHPARSAKRSQM